MENKDILSIKEFAKIAQVTSQSIYQRLDTSLQDYLVNIKGHKYLKVQALKEIYNIDYKDSKQDSKQCADTNKEENKDKKEDIQALKIDYLVQMLKDKQEEIHKIKMYYDKLIAEKDNLINSLQNDKIYLQNELSKSNDRFTEQQQIIKLMTLPKQIETVAHEQSEQESKKGFFKFFK